MSTWKSLDESWGAEDLESASELCKYVFLCLEEMELKPLAINGPAFESLLMDGKGGAIEILVGHPSSTELTVFLYSEDPLIDIESNPQDCVALDINDPRCFDILRNLVLKIQ